MQKMKDVTSIPTDVANELRAKIDNKQPRSGNPVTVKVIGNLKLARSSKTSWRKHVENALRDLSHVPHKDDPDRIARLLKNVVATKSGLKSKADIDLAKRLDVFTSKAPVSAYTPMGAIPEFTSKDIDMINAMIARRKRPDLAGKLEGKDLIAGTIMVD
jgi:hypothetical protein